MTDKILSALTADALRVITKEALGPEIQAIVDEIAAVLAVRASHRAHLGKNNAGLTQSEEARLNYDARSMLKEVFEAKGFKVHTGAEHPGLSNSFWISW